ncbi:hypothetical protein [Algoriphagus sediminis]|uniref:Alpha/beta hydrolase n=1 Tax=Algoriphagus sediminis TaxID=3057113 RepID=A0ABT7YEZ9_9BACT|nr:hypothetical protein [Algoriphagus sediminis]MDN3205098.1 hypothetical protein [Algoriphagus sediminis]
MIFLEWNKRSIFTILFWLGGYCTYAQSFQIPVPLDHFNPNSRKITIGYSVSESFDFSKKTILVLNDPIDEYLGLNEIIQDVNEGDFNLIRVQGRFFSKDLEDFLDSHNQTWNQKYLWLNHDQIIRDIETIRHEILGKEEVILVGFGSSASILFHYLNSFPDKVEKVIALNPLLLDVQENLSFWNLFESLSKNYSSDSEKRLNFAIHSSRPYFFYTKNERDSLFRVDFESYNVNGLSQSREAFVDGARVRALELIPPDYTNGKSPLVESLGELAEPLIQSISEKKFSKSGIRYDEGLKFDGEVVIIGALNNLFIDPKTFDAIGEFYPDSQIFLLRDGYSLFETRLSNLVPEIINVFSGDNTEDKVDLILELKKDSLLYQGKNYNNIVISK